MPCTRSTAVAPKLRCWPPRIGPLPVTRPSPRHCRVPVTLNRAAAELRRGLAAQADRDGCADRVGLQRRNAARVDHRAETGIGHSCVKQRRQQGRCESP